MASGPGAVCFEVLRSVGRAYGGRRPASSNMGGGSLRTLVAEQCLRSLGRQVRNRCEPVPDERPLTLGDRALFEEKIAKLTEQLDAESAARLFAEGALRSARQERSARRQEGHDVAAESPSAETDPADSKVTWLRR